MTVSWSLNCLHVMVCVALRCSRSQNLSSRTYQGQQHCLMVPCAGPHELCQVAGLLCTWRTKHPLVATEYNKTYNSFIADVQVFQKLWNFTRPAAWTCAGFRLIFRVTLLYSGQKGRSHQSRLTRTWVEQRLHYWRWRWWSYWKTENPNALWRWVVSGPEI